MLTQLDAKPVDQSDQYATMPFKNIKTACSVSKRTPSPAYKRPSLLSTADTRALNPHRQKSRHRQRLITAVSFLEHCPTPAGRQSPHHLRAAGVRQS